MAVETDNVCEPIIADDAKQHLKTAALRAYSTHQKQLLDDERVVEFLPMVRKIAQRAVSYLRPPLSFEDLISAGTIGLIKAARDFDPSHQVEFKTYAYTRIKGAILDELRSLSLLPPNLNKQIRAATRASRKISEQTGTTPADEELAGKLGITVGQLHKAFEGARAQHFLSIDGLGEENPALGEMLAARNTSRPDQQLERTELINRLTEAITQLDRRQRQVILLYYQQSLTMKQIGQVLTITESRVSQLHASALFNLSAKLRQWNNGR